MNVDLNNSFILDILCIDSLEAFRDLHEAQITQLEKPIDTPDSVPLELQDGFDEMLCQAVDEYESSDPTKRGLKRALEVQKINETTPKRPSKVLSGIDLALGQQLVAKKACFGVAPRKKLNFG